MSGKSPYSIDTENFARLASCIIGPCTSMTREVLSMYTPPAKLIGRMPNKLLNSLDHEQKKQLGTGAVPDYTNFDMSFMYVLLRTIGICIPSVKPPTNGWGKPPLSPSEITLGDDIERLRLMKNDMCSHIKKPEVTTSEFNIKMSELKDIAARFDALLAPSPSFVTEINEMETQSLEPEVKKYYQEQIEELKNREKWYKDYMEKLEQQEKDTLKEVESVKGDVAKLETKINETETKLDKAVERLDSDAVKLNDKMDKLKLDTDTKFKQCISAIDKQTEQMSKLSTTVEEADKRLSQSVEVLSKVSEQNTQEESFLREIQTEDVTFIETRAYHESVLRLQQNKVISVIGVTGQGKTAIAKHIALGFSEKGYRVLNVRTVQEFKFKYQNNEKQKTLFIVDDAFGKHYKIQTIIDDWNHCADDIVRWTCHYDLCGIFTSQKIVWNTCRKCLDFRPLFQNIVDLTSRDIMLSPDEKAMILKNHLLFYNKEISETDFHKIVSTDAALGFLGFPQCCKSFCSNDQLFQSGIDYFYNPQEKLKDEFERMLEIDVDRFCVLLCVLVIGSDFPDSFWKIGRMPIKDKVEKILEPFGIELNKSIDRLQKVLENLKKCNYLKPKGKISFIHDAYADALCIVQGKRDPDTILQYCSANVFHQYVRLQDQTTCSSDESTIFVLPSCRSLLNCVLRLFESDDLYLVFDNPVIYNEEFIHHLCDYVSNHTASCLFMALQVEDRKSVLEYCFDSNRAELIKFAIHSINVFRRREEPHHDQSHVVKCMNECLCIACRLGGIDAVVCLIEMGADVSYSSVKSHGLHPLLWCVGSGHVSLLELLLQFGADVNSGDEKGQTALHYAVNQCPESGKLQIIDVLIENGAKSKLEDHRGKTAEDLLYNRNYSSIEMLRFKLTLNPEKALMEEGIRDKIFSFIDKNEVFSSGKSLVHLIVEDEHILKELLNTGVNINCLDNNGQTPLHHLVKRRLIRRPKNPDRRITLRDPSCWNSLKVILKSDVELDIQDKFSKTALHYAVEKGNVYVLLRLCKYKAKVQALDSENKTPLHYAVSEWSRNHNMLIMDHDYDKIEKKLSPALPFIYLSEMINDKIKRNVYGLCCLVLLMYGAHTECIDSHGNTPFDYADRNLISDQYIAFCKRITDLNEDRIIYRK